MAQKHKNTLSIKIHPFVSIALFFGDFPFVLGTKRKRIYQTTYSLRERERVVRRDDTDDDVLFNGPKGIFVRLVFFVFFFFATKEEDEEGGRIEHFVTFVYVSCNVILLSRFLSLVFSLSLFGTMELTFVVFHPLTLSLFHQEVSKNTRSIIVRAASKSSGTNKNTNNHTNNTTNNNENNNRKTQRAYRVRSTATNDFQQQQQKPYASYREKHGYNWTYGAAEDDVNDDDDESGEYGSVSEADAREAARNWLCTIGRQGQTSPIDFEKAQYNARRGKRVSEEFRGTLLDDPFTNNPKVFEFMRTRRGPMVGKLGKALRHVHGDEAYESYLGKHVNRHIRLARILKLWRINFHIRFGREPGYDDMPSNLKTLELQYINIGFKLRELDG